MNLEHDVNEVGVQVILVVEDGIRFYSSILPNLYKFVLKQSQEFSTEALNAHQRTLRMRGRPKIVLARTYEEAIGIYEKYKNNILGVITDVRFPRVERGEKDGLAGIKLCAAIRKEDPFVPLIIQSSESENALYASKYGAAFIDKNSKKISDMKDQSVSERKQELLYAKYLNQDYEKIMEVLDQDEASPEEKLQAYDDYKQNSQVNAYNREVHRIKKEFDLETWLMAKIQFQSHGEIHDVMADGLDLSQIGTDFIKKFLV